MGANGNGVPDWVEIRLGATNGFDRLEVRSQTSRATVEGRARSFDLLNTHGAAVAKAPNGRFYAEVPLVSGEVRSLGFEFENGAVNQTATVRWEPTNILQNPGAITVRAGDRLLRAAYRNTQQTPSLPDAAPLSDRPRCGGRESKFLAASYFISRQGPVLDHFKNSPHSSRTSGESILSWLSRRPNRARQKSPLPRSPLTLFLCNQQGVS